MGLSFGTIGREYINQIEMIQYRVIRYVYSTIITYIGSGKPTKASVIPVWRHYDEIFSRDQSKRRIADTPSLTSLQKL